jgi:hypothetical protein
MLETTKVFGVEPNLQSPLSKIMRLLERMKTSIPESDVFTELIENTGLKPIKEEINNIMVDTSCAIIDAQIKTFTPYLEIEKHYIRLIQLKAMYRVLSELNEFEKTTHKTLLKVGSMLNDIHLELDEIESKLDRLKTNKTPNTDVR